jgi:hypothetical protein
VVQAEELASRQQQVSQTRVLAVVAEVITQQLAAQAAQASLSLATQARSVAQVVLLHHQVETPSIPSLALALTSHEHLN